MRAYLKKLYSDRVHSTTVIEANRQWFRIDWVELWQFRDLITLFIKKEFISRYRQTILGPLWYVLQPILMSVVLTLVFGKLGGMATDGSPHLLFYLSGLVVWGYFTVSFQQTADVLISNAYIFRKVYFPRLVMPISVVVSKSLVFFTQLGVFLTLLVYYKYFSATQDSVHPDLLKIAILTPLSLLTTACLSLGLGLIFAAMTVRYKDLSHVLGFFMQLWFYATPIVYPVNRIPEKFRFVLLLNPLIAVVDAFRSAFLGTQGLETPFLLMALTISCLLVCVGVMMFNIVERDFVDVI